MPDPAVERLGLDAALRARVGETVHERYFRGHATLSAAGGRACVTSATKFHAQMLDRRFGRELREAFASELTISASEVDIEFLVDPGLDGAARVEIATPTRAAPQARKPKPKPAARLEPFIVGESNRLAHDAVQRLAFEDESHLSPLVIHGQCGVGKTHLLRTAASVYRKAHPTARIRVMTSDQFTTEFVTAIRAGRGSHVRRSIATTDLVCIDDVHFLSSRDATQGELVQTIDAVSQTGTKIVLASDEHPNRIRTLRAALRSRLVAGMVVEVLPPDPALCGALVRTFAERAGMELTPDAVALVPMLLAKSSGAGACSVRELIGAVTKLSAAAGLLGSRAAHGLVGPGLVRQTLESRPMSDSRASAGGGAVGFDRILRVVCEELLVDPADLGTSGRHKRVVLARGIVTMLSREMTTLSYPEIARAMGKKGHSTMIMAERRIAGQIRSGEVADVGTGCPPMLASMSCEELVARVRTRLRP